VAERITIARPYAKAAFAQARAGSQLEAWSQALATAAAVAGDARVKPLFGNPHVSPQQLAALFNDIGGAAFSGEVQNFIATLAANRRLGFLPEVAGRFEQLRADHERKVDVTVSSAVELSAAQRERLIAALGKRLNREVRLHSELNPALLGGAVLRADDLVIDGSLSGGLSQLAARVAG
jgi:F-type H+-transporting ATPase subunit delta